MGVKTDLWQDTILQTMDGGTIPVWYPWAALLTSVISQELGQVTETTYTSYTRQLIQYVWYWDTGGWSSAGDLTFPTCTGGGPITVTHLGIYTGLLSGDLRYVFPLETPRLIDAGTTPVIAFYDLTVNET